MEVDNLVDTVDELRTHTHPQLLLLEVGGHDEQGVLEIHRPALVVGQTTIVQHLKQDVEHIRMRLLDFIEQDDGIWFAPYRLSELSALIIAYISRRRADKTADRVGLLILGHIDTRHHGLVIEQELGQGLGQLGLTHTGSAQEEEGAQRPVLVGKPRAASAHCVGHGTDGLILAYYPLVEGLFHVQELARLALKHPAHRDSGPAGYNLRNVLRGNGFSDYRVLDLRLLFEQLVHSLLKLADTAVAQLGHLSIVSLTLCHFGLLATFLDLLAAALKLLEYGILALPACAEL